MLCICKRELRSFFHSMIGWVFGAFLLLMAGIYFTAYNLNYGYPLFSYTLSSITFLFLIVSPILAMRTLAEERKQKTDQLLLTAPVTVWQIVLGKYLALIVTFLLPVVILCFYPLIMAQYGSIAFASTYVALLGFFLLGCTCLAVGLFFSSLTESQILAAVGTFAFLLLCYLMDGISGFFPETAGASFFALVVIVLLIGLLIYHTTQNILLPLVIGVIGEGVLAVLYFVKQSMFEGIIQKILNLFNMSSHFSNFTNSILDLTGVVYYLSFIGIMLFLTVQSIQKRRWN